MFGKRVTKWHDDFSSKQKELSLISIFPSFLIQDQRLTRTSAIFIFEYWIINEIHNQMKARTMNRDYRILSSKYSSQRFIKFSIDEVKYINLGEFHS